MTIPGSEIFYRNRKYSANLRASYEVISMEWLHHSVVDNVDAGEEEDDDGGDLSPQLPVGHEHGEGGHIGEEAEDGQGDAYPARHLVCV